MTNNKENLKITHVDAKDLKPSEYNPRKWSQQAIDSLTVSIKRFGLIDPIIANSAPSRLNVVIGGHFRLKIAKDIGMTSIPTVYINIPDIEKEKELNLRLNKNTS
jgi:ParB-like chromosome segregation protein Spo0J